MLKKTSAQILFFLVFAGIKPEINSYILSSISFAQKFSQINKALIVAL